MATYATPAASSGLQYFGAGGVFDGVSNGVNLVTDGTSGNDFIIGTRGNDTISGGGANDLINGWSGNDLIFGGKGNDVITGGSGSDTVIASSGNDIMSGGSGGAGLHGIDTLDYSLMKGNLDLNFGKHTANIGSGHAVYHQTVAGFEVVVGTTHGTDTIMGDHNANTFISAGANNTFRGGLGNDTLVGGAGSDTYVLTKHDISDGSTKTFANFTVGQDTVNLADFMKGHTDPNAEFRFGDIVNADGTHSTEVQALVHHQWTNVVTLAGINAYDVGADHHALTYADLHPAATTTTTGGGLLV